MECNTCGKEVDEPVKAFLNKLEYHFDEWLDWLQYGSMDGSPRFSDDERWMVETRMVDKIMEKLIDCCEDNRNI